MSLEIVEVLPSAESLRRYGSITPEHWAVSRLQTDLLVPGVAVQTFVETPVPPFAKGADTVEYGPESWSKREGIARWTILQAQEGEQPVGGAAIALQPEDSWFFPADPGLAVLWDLRVAPAHRRKGVASALLRAAVAAATRQGCSWLAIETQDTNVGACRLYASAGAILTEVRRGAYAEYPDEAALLWRIELD